MKPISLIFRVITIPLIAGCLLFAGKWPLVEGYLISHNFSKDGVVLFQGACFLFGTLFSIVILPIDIYMLKRDLESTRKKYEELVSFNSKLHLNLVINQLTPVPRTINTRFFVPKKGLGGWIDRVLKRNQYFCLKEISGITTPLVNKLKFRVFPQDKSQGIVGKVYNSKKGFVELNANEKEFNLDDYQKNHTTEVIFCAGAAILNEDNKVIAILTFDSHESLAIEKNMMKGFETEMHKYCSFITKHVKF